MIILSVLDVVSAHDFDFSEVGILFPLQADEDEKTVKVEKTEIHVEKVDFFEELLLVMLELPDHDNLAGCRREADATF